MVFTYRVSANKIKITLYGARLEAMAAAAGAGVGGLGLLARTTCDRHRIVYNGCCRDSATNLKPLSQCLMFDI